MTELSVLERVRAAVAEAGYDPNLIVAPSKPGASFRWLSPVLPDKVAWRAREVADIREPRCSACFHHEPYVWGADPCLADRRFVEDCGRDRSEP